MRDAVTAVLAEQTDLVVEAVDVHVRDLLPAPTGTAHEADEDGA